MHTTFVDARALAALFAADSREQIVAVSREAAQNGCRQPLPADLATELDEAIRGREIDTLYGHQRAAYDLLSQGANVVIATATASGKSLCSQLAILNRQLRDRQSRSLMLFPTKALAQDQLRSLAAFKLGGVVPAIYDGDTPTESRALLRRSATILLSNPDMLHVGILPHHERWAEFLHHLDYVMLDEAHVYRGVFGSHVAQTIRRLRRLCARYGGRPQFILASATIGNPLELAERLVGVPFSLIDEDQAPRAERTIVFWNPPLLDPAGGDRVSALSEAAQIATECILADARVIAFASGRRAAEIITQHVRRRLEQRGADAAATRVQPYRAGYTAQQRREIERALFAHELDAVVATQALELGIDVGALDVAIVTGFPGTVTSLRQRWGRAGRRGHGWAVLVGGQDALDQFFMREPDRLLERAVEEAIIDLQNPHIERAHLEAAAYEAPLSAADAEFFAAGALQTAARLADRGLLRRRGDELIWAGDDSPAPHFGLRSADNSQRFTIVETGAGEVIGELEHSRLYRHAHPGAVYLHLGTSYLVRAVDLSTRTILVEPFSGSYYTQAKIATNVTIVAQSEVRTLSSGLLVRGEVEVSQRISAYLRRDSGDQHVLDSIDLDLPEQTFATEALWIIAADAALEQLGSGDDKALLIAGSLHAAEHALIALLPLYAMCDRWDIGGLSTPWHGQTEAATIFIYDGYAGGIGLSHRAFGRFDHWAGDTLAMIAGCPCESGCPSCVQSPKCGNLNEPLNKEGASHLLRHLLQNSPADGEPPS